MKVAPPPSPASVSSSILSSTSSNVSPLGRTAAKPQTTIESAPPSQMGLGYGASWKAGYSRLADEIHLRHYSSKTLQTYQGWAKKFQAFTHSKAPELLSTDDVKKFLTFLAVKRKVASTTQNQAFNAFLFFIVMSCAKNSERSTGLSGRSENLISRSFYPVKKSMPS
jgi:hypothetical protein